MEQSDRSVSGVHLSTFSRELESKAASSKSRIILALDLEHSADSEQLAKRARDLISLTRESICAVKFNFHLLLPLSLRELSSITEYAASLGLASIADLKLNDIASTNSVVLKYLRNAHFSAVIVNPFAGFHGALDVVFQEAKLSGMGVITLAYMSHAGADEGYGLELAGRTTIFQAFLERANAWGADGVIVGSTRPDRIGEARRALRKEIKILSPGSGAQGGDPLEALQAGADFLIYGRSIVSSKDPASAARRIYRELLPWTGRS